MLLNFCLTAGQVRIILLSNPKNKSLISKTNCEKSGEMEHKHLCLHFYNYLSFVPIRNCLRCLFKMFIYSDSYFLLLFFFTG